MVSKVKKPKVPTNNPVKKYSDQFNRPATHKDRKKELKKQSGRITIVFKGGILMSIWTRIVGSFQCQPM